MSHFIQVTHQVDIYHLVYGSDKEEHEATPSYTAIKVSIQPAGADILAIYPGQATFQPYQMFVFDNITIKNGDKVIGSGETFYVRGVPRTYDFADMYYQEVVLEKVVGS